MSNPVVHFEIPAKNVARAQKFYASVFGWKMTGMPEMDYTLVQTTPTGRNGVKDPGCINGGMMKRSGFSKSPNVVIMVKDINASLRKAKAKGAKVLQPKTSIGEMGFTAYFRDPEGNVTGLFQAGR